METCKLDRKCVKQILCWLAPLALVAALSAPAFAQEHGESHATASGEGAHEGGSHGGVSPADWNWFDMGYKSKNAEGQSLEEHGGHGMAPPALFALINAFIFFGLLVWKGGPPIKNFVKQRHLTIKEALEESARLRDDARDKLEDYSKRIAGVEAEVEKIFSEIRADAEAEKQRILEAAKAQAESIKANAEDRIAAEMAQARRELEAEVVEAAIMAAEKLIKVTATPADHKTLIDTFITDMGKDAPSAQPRRPS